MTKVLLLGAGHRRDLILRPPGHPIVTGPLETLPPRDDVEITTLDNNPECKPDYLFDLSNIDARWEHTGLRFLPNQFDELHAYEVLEHCGAQGDARKLLDQFSEFWRVLKPGGYFLATVPWWQGEWAWGDPSHTRIIQPATLTFLHQPAYTAQVGKTPMSDFRRFYRADFDLLRIENWQNQTLAFVLKAVKPSRISPDGN